jgi:hypothetical protein
MSFEMRASVVEGVREAPLSVFRRGGVKQFEPAPPTKGI